MDVWLTVGDLFEARTKGRRLDCIRAVPGSMDFSLVSGKPDPRSAPRLNHEPVGDEGLGLSRFHHLISNLNFDIGRTADRKQWVSLSQTPLLRRNMALAGSRFYRRPHVHAPVSHPFGPFLPLSRPKLP